MNFQTTQSVGLQNLPAKPDCIRLWVIIWALFWGVTACQKNETQPLPTLNPVAQIAAAETPAPDNVVVDGLVAAATEEPVLVNDDRPVISVWHSWQGELANVLMAGIAAYESQQPGVNVEAVYQENLLDAVTTAVPLGEGPDVFLMSQDSLGTFAAAGLIAPLPAPFDPAYLDETFNPAAAAAVQWQNEVWGIPLYQQGIALIYNKAQNVASLIPQDPTNFGQLLANAIIYHQDNPDNYLVCNPSLTAVSPDVYHAAPILFGFNPAADDRFIDDWGNVRLNTPEYQAAAAWMKELSLVSPPGPSYETCQEGLLAGQVASWWTGPWALDVLREAGIDYGIQGFGRPYVHVSAMFMGANATERGRAEAAADFIAFWGAPTQQTQLALAANNPPASLQALESPEIQANWELAAFGRALANGVPFPANPLADAQWAPLGEAIQSIVSGGQSPDAALAAAETAVNQTITAVQNP